MTSKIGAGQTDKTADKPLPGAMMLGISYEKLPVGNSGMMNRTKQLAAGGKPPKMFLGGIGTEPDDDDVEDKKQSSEPKGDPEPVGDMRRTRGDHPDVGILATTACLPAAVCATA